MTQDPKANLFISYAHADKQYIPEILKYLNTTFCPQVNFWVDKEIQLGQEWNDEILNNLKNADIILFLISQDFLMSTYIQTIEIKNALLRHDEKKCVVIPIFLRYCNLKKNPELTKLQGYPSKDKPLAESGVEKDRHYTEIQERINTIAEKIATDKNIAQSLEKGTDKNKTGAAQEIDKLRNLKNIFLSLPASEEGNEIRKNFIFSVEGKIKYETPDWPYEIKPGIRDAIELSNTLKDAPEKIVSKLPDKFIYSILIIATAEDLKKLQDTKQYELAKETNDRSDINHTILWFLNSEVKAELDKLDEPFRLELKMLPSYVGTDAKPIFKLIDEFDTAREKKINQLSTPFSSLKKVYMFYDYSKDNENELRIALRKEIQADKTIAIRDLAYETIEEEKKAIEECNGAIIFYGPNSDSVWYKMRERIILKAKNIKIGAVCVDGAPDTEIEKKIDRDVSVSEILPIKGAKEFNNAINIFKTKLQES
jgi:hypothetical protein